MYLNACPSSMAFVRTNVSAEGFRNHGIGCTAARCMEVQCRVWSSWSKPDLLTAETAVANIATCIKGNVFAQPSKNLLTSAKRTTANKWMALCQALLSTSGRHLNISGGCRPFERLCFVCLSNRTNYRDHDKAKLFSVRHAAVRYLKYCTKAGEQSAN